MAILLWEETFKDLKRRRCLGVAEEEKREEDGVAEVEGRAVVSFDFPGFALDLGDGSGLVVVVELEAEALMRLEVRRSAGMVFEREGESGSGRRGSEGRARSLLTELEVWEGRQKYRLAIRC